MKESLKKNFLQDNKISNGNLLLKNELDIIDEVILVDIANEDVFQLYMKFVQNKSNSVNYDLVLSFRNFAVLLSDEQKFVESLLLFRFIITKSCLIPSDYFYIGRNLSKYEGHNDLVSKLFQIYEQIEKNKQFLFLNLGNFYNLEEKNYEKAISYYEEYLKIDDTKAIIYTTLAGLYKKLDKQNNYLKYLIKAYNINPNDRGVLHELAFGFEDIFDYEKAKFFYEQLLKNNPTDNDYFNYGCLLITLGDLLNGHRYFTKRQSKFLKIIPEEKRWNIGCQINGKRVLVTYEQGFGDTFMYCRFLPILRSLCSSVVFYAQKEVVSLLKSSFKFFDGIELITDFSEIESLDYDINVPIFDLSYILNVTKDNMPYSQGYLSVDEKDILDFRKKFIKNSSDLKIGIAYQGDKNANYNGRDLTESDFNYLINNIDAEFYSLQYGEDSLNPKIIPLGKFFKDFKDSACAIKNMDLVITTDNVILNLSGALGVKTLGLFNKKTNFRWYNLQGDNVGYYDNVKPLQCEKQDDWPLVFDKILNEINHLKLC